MSLLSRSSPESAHSEVLHEATLASVSSVRDALPEQYRRHFDILRQEIIDFAQAHGIPREALSKSDALRKVAEKLPTSDLERLAHLLERFQHLIVEKKPWTNKEALEYAEVHYHLREQYDSQVALLEQVGILKEGAILGIDKKEYPIPTLEQIAIRLFERREGLETKHDQGFTKLLLVPFGMSLDVLIETFKQFLLSYHGESYPDFNLDIEEPISLHQEYVAADIGDSPKLVYYPQSFTEEDHGGKTKMEILEGRGDPAPTYGRGSFAHPFPGWTVHLLQPSDPSNPDSKGFAPIRGEGEEKVYGNRIPRRDFDTGRTPNTYCSILKEAQNNEDSPYFHESGMTLEDWIIAFMTHLQETKQPLDSWSDTGGNIPYLIGSFFPPVFRFIPYVGWSYLSRCVDIDSIASSNQTHFLGTRTSIIV